MFQVWLPSAKESEASDRETGQSYLKVTRLMNQTNKVEQIWYPACKGLTGKTYTDCHHCVGMSECVKHGL